MGPACTACPDAEVGEHLGVQFYGWGQAKAPSGAFASVSAGNEHTCGLRTDGLVECWGGEEDEPEPAMPPAPPTPLPLGTEEGQGAPLWSWQTEGSGDTRMTIELDEGSYLVEMTVTNNQDCSSGECKPGDFQVVIWSEDLNSVTSPYIGNAVDAIGKAVIVVGNDPGDDLPPGSQLMVVSSFGDWTITFTKKEE